MFLKLVKKNIFNIDNWQISKMFKELQQVSEKGKEKRKEKRRPQHRQMTDK